MALLDGRIARRGLRRDLAGQPAPHCPRTESLADVAESWSYLRDQTRAGAKAVASAATAQMFATARPGEG